MQLAYISLFICLMQCLCIGSDGNSDTTDNDGELMTITDLIQKHHYLGQKNNKKKLLMHCFRTAPFVFFYE